MEKSVETYLQLLDESLVKKLSVLNQILDIDKNQEESLKEESLDADRVDELMNQKDKLIKELDKLDDGFDSVYGRIREEITECPEKYKTQVAKLQDDIRNITELQTKIEALEKRLKKAVSEYASKASANLQSKRNLSSAARNYYESVNKLQMNNPQFMDKKK